MRGTDSAHGKPETQITSDGGVQRQDSSAGIGAVAPSGKKGGPHRCVLGARCGQDVSRRQNQSRRRKIMVEIKTTMVNPQPAKPGGKSHTVCVDGDSVSWYGDGSTVFCFHYTKGCGLTPADFRKFS